MDGQPFMVVNQVVDPGLIKTIENTLLPELKARLPHQVQPQTQAMNTPRPNRFTLVFDREGYSPDFLARMKAQHIANVVSDKLIEKLCVELTATETRFPRTNLRMIFKLGSN